MSVLDRPVLSDSEAFNNFIEAIKIAESSAKQIAFYRQQPEWIQVESTLGKVREVATALAVRRLQ